MSAIDVLVVERDDPTRRLLVSVFREAGLDARAAEDTMPAVVPRLLVVDLPAPKTAGPEAVRALRRRYPDATVLALSARFDFPASAGASVARQMGAECVMAKPLDLAALVAAARRLLAGRPR